MGVVDLYFKQVVTGLDCIRYVEAESGIASDMLSDSLAVDFCTSNLVGSLEMKVDRPLVRSFRDIHAPDISAGAAEIS